jgi:hypothetical protein
MFLKAAVIFLTLATVTPNLQGRTEWLRSPGVVLPDKEHEIFLEPAVLGELQKSIASLQ